MYDIDLLIVIFSVECDKYFHIYLLFFSDEVPTLETLDFTIRIDSTPTFSYFDYYFYFYLYRLVSEGWCFRSAIKNDPTWSIPHILYKSADLTHPHVQNLLSHSQTHSHLSHTWCLTFCVCCHFNLKLGWFRDNFSGADGIWRRFIKHGWSWASL